MEKTLLWEAFCTFSRTEYREFARFVQSPFFNRKKQLELLCEYLLRCVDAKQLPNESTAFSMAFPEEAVFSSQKLRLANSDLLALIEQFWVVQAQLAQTTANDLLIAAIYRKRNLTRHALIARREAQSALQQHPFRNADYYELSHAFEMEVYQSASAAQRYEDFNLQEISDLTDCHFIARKLRHTCLILSHNAVVKKEYQLGLYALLLDYMEQSPLLEQPAIGLYYHACRFLSNPQADGHFQQFRVDLVQFADQFPPEEQRALFLLAINFGVKKSNAHGQPWYSETLQLYKTALERGLLFENGQLSRFAYNNMVGIAIRINEIDWAETFIHQYRPTLERKYREAAFSLNAARLAFIKKDYGSALMYLQKADYKDFINSMNAKTLQLKIYYQTAAVELLESHLESMQHFIRRQRAVGYHRENYLNIVRFTRALLRCTSAAEREALRLQIQETQPLTEREWLLDMAK